MPKSKEVQDALNDPNLSDEGKEVLKEMEEEGLFNSEEDIKTEEETEKEKKKEGAEEEKEEEEEKKEEKEEQTTEEEEKEEEEEEEEEERGRRQKEARTPRLMPVWKYKIAEKEWLKKAKETEKKIQELEATINELKKKPATTEREEEIETAMEEFAEESGLDKETLEKLTGLIKKSILKEIPREGGLSEEEREKLRKIEEAITWSREDKLFEEEYNKDIVPLIKEMQIPEENERKIKKTLYNLAFTEEFSKLPLREIIRTSAFDDLVPIGGGTKRKGRRTAESTSGARATPRRGEVLTGEDILGKEQIPDEEFDKILEGIMKSAEAKKFRPVDQQI